MPPASTSSALRTGAAIASPSGISENARRLTSSRYWSCRRVASASADSLASASAPAEVSRPMPRQLCAVREVPKSVSDEIVAKGRGGA